MHLWEVVYGIGNGSERTSAGKEREWRMWNNNIVLFKSINRLVYWTGHVKFYT